MGPLEDLNAPKSVVAHSRAVNGVSFDPFHEHRLLTFSDDGIIKLWDIRKLNQPVGPLAWEMVVMGYNSSLVDW